MPSVQFKARKRLFISRFLFVGSLMVFLTVFSSCSNIFSSTIHNVTPIPKSTVLGDLVMEGFLTVGSYTDYPPQEDIDQTTNTAIGFDVDLITAIARQMHLKTRIISIDFRSIINNLLVENIDVAISAIIITPELQQRVNFLPYFIGGESLLVVKGNPLKIDSLQNLCGLKVAASTSSLEQKDLMMASTNCQQKKKPPIQIIVSQDQMAVVQLLLDKHVVASYEDAPVTDYFIKQYPDRFEVGGPVIDSSLEGIAVRKDDTTLFNDMQAAFTVVKTDGTYCSLIKKWGLTGGVLLQNNRPIC